MSHSANAVGCGADVAAYALGALDDHEVTAFRAHLQSCTICQEELAAFEQVVAELPLSAPAHRTPRRLRRRVMASVAAEPKGSHIPASSGLAGWRSRLALPAPRAGLALAATFAVLAVLAGTVLVAGSGGSGARVINAQVIGQPGSAKVRISAGHAELLVSHFGPPPRGQIYEVWLARPGRQLAPTKLLFSPTRSGAADVDVPGDLEGVSAVMVTAEPAGGSLVPTHPVVIRAPLT